MVKKSKKKRCLRMPIAVPRSGGNFETCPEGEYNAVLVDVVDLGMVTTKFSNQTKTQPKIVLCWQVDKIDEKGLPFLIFKRYTNSLHEKATLTKDLKDWFTKKAVAAVLPSVRKDVEVLLGKGCRLEVEHNEYDGKIYATVQSLRPLAEGTKAPSVHPEFVRKKDRQEGQGPFGKRTAKASDPEQGNEDEHPW